MEAKQCPKLTSHLVSIANPQLRTTIVSQFNLLANSGLYELLSDSHLESPPIVALWHIPSFHALCLYLYLRSRDCIVAWINNRWTVSDVVQVVSTVPIQYIILPSEDEQDSQLWQLNPYNDIVTKFYRLGIHTITCKWNHDQLKFQLLARDDILSKLSYMKWQFFRTKSLPNDTASIFFTSGTTSVPKPVMLSDNNHHVQCTTKINLFSLSSSTVYFHLAPLFHLGGFSSALSCVYAQSKLIFPPTHLHPMNPQDASQLIDLIEIHKVTYLVVVPTILTLLLDAAHGRIIKSVKHILYGGNAPTKRLLDDTRLIFPYAQIMGAYGMTETASSITFLNHNKLPTDSKLNTSAGWPPSHIELRILPMKSNHDQLPHSIGEVITRGSHVMKGYYGISMKRCFLEDQWFRTGDLGYIDSQSGALFLVGRIGDVIKSGGEKVFAGEIENVIRKHPVVKETAVVGIPHRLLGEAIVAAVVLTNQQDTIIQDIENVCKQSLASYKCPRWILELDGLPKTSTGKVVKSELKFVLQTKVKPQLAKF